MSTRPSSSAPDESGARGPVVPPGVVPPGDGLLRERPRQTNVYEPDHKWSMKLTFAIGLGAIVIIVGVALFIVNRPGPSSAPTITTTTIPFATGGTAPATAAEPASVEVLAGGGAVTQIRNGQTATADVDLEPTGVGVSPDGGGPDQSVIVGDAKRRGVLKFANDKVVQLVGVTGSPYDALQGVGASLGRPDHLVVDDAQTTWFTDQVGIFKMDAQGAVVRVGPYPLVAPSVNGSKELRPVSAVGGLALDRLGTLHVATDKGIFEVQGDQLVLEAGGGTARGDNIPALGAALDGLQALAMAPDGSMYVIDGLGRVRRVDPLGNLTTLPELPGGGHVLVDLEVDRAGTVFAVDRGTRQIWQLGTVPIAVAGSGRTGFPKGPTPPMQADMTDIQRLTIDTTGTMYVTDAGTGRVYKITGIAARG